MKITPLDIRKQDFTRRLRGYDPEEVQAFLHTLSSQWDTVLEDARRYEERLREMESKLRHYERVEEALQEALQTARESARQAMQIAEQKAQQIRSEAEGEAERIKRDAEQDRLRMRQETQAIHNRRKEIVARLRGFLFSEMEMLAHFEGEDPTGFIQLLPPEHRRRLGASVELEDDEQIHAAAGADDPYPFAVVDSDDAHPSYTQIADEPVGDAAEPDAEVSFPPSEPESDRADVAIPEPEATADDTGADQPETMGERLLRLDQEADPDTGEAPAEKDIWTTPVQVAEQGAQAPVSEPEPAEEEPPTAPRPAGEESGEQNTRPGWRQKSIIGLGQAQGRSPSETVSAAEEEIARIRRILSQLD